MLMLRFEFTCAILQRHWWENVLSTEMQKERVTCNCDAEPNERFNSVMHWILHSRKFAIRWRDKWVCNAESQKDAYVTVL